MKNIIVALTTLIMSIVAAQAQDWLNQSMYPFENHYIQLEPGKIHYVDEGKGDVILFVHGTPTWSFLYREYIRDLSKDYRCIAIDHIGFGLSEKPRSMSLNPEDHSKNLSEFIKRLNLENITLVVHDFGGPIGLSAAIEQPDRFEKIVLFNSWLWSTKGDSMAMEIDKLVHSEAGSDYYMNKNYSTVVLLKQAFFDKDKLSEELHGHYIEPFAEKFTRQALLDIGKAFVGSSDWYEENWKKLKRLENKPWLIQWGTKDQFLNSTYLNKWKSRLPQARVVEYDSGHFVQEEMTKETIAEIRNFMLGK